MILIVITLAFISQNLISIIESTKKRERMMRAISSTRGRGRLYILCEREIERERENIHGNIVVKESNTVSRSAK